MHALKAYAMTALANRERPSDTMSNMMQQIYKWRAKFVEAESDSRAYQHANQVLIDGIRKMLEDPATPKETRALIMKHVGIAARENKYDLRAITDKKKFEEYGRITRKMSGIE